MMNDELEGLLDEMDEFIRRAIDAETTSQTIEMLSGMTIEQVAEGFRDGKFDPKKELPVVPTWFDEWWKDVYKGEGNLLHNIAQFHDKLYSYGTREMGVYIEDSGNKKKLLNIIINELDYKVEEEHRYYVLFGSQLHDDNWTYALTKSGSIEFFEKDVLPEWDRTKLTEQEIKDYDERYIPFMVPVDEVNND